MRLTSLRVKNYGCLADFELPELGPLAVFVGANGSGKSTLFDVFAFLRDALRDDVRTAVANRGGFEILRTRGADGPIEIKIGVGRDPEHWTPNAVTPAGTYTVAIDNESDAPYIRSERIMIRLAEQDANRDVTLLDTDHNGAAKRPRTARLQLERPDEVIAAALREERIGKADAPAALAAVEELRALLRGAHFSDIDPALAKQPCAANADHRLTECGDNLAKVVKHRLETDRSAFDEAFRLVRRAAPDLESVKACDTADGRIALEFVECGGTRIPAQRVSNGTIKLLAYTLLLNEPQHRPLLCLDQPEHHVYPSLLWELLEEIAAYTWRPDAQVLVTTHQPGLLDAAEPHDVFWLVRKDGGSRVYRVSDDPQLIAEHDYGGQLGFMWRTGSFLGAHPS